MASKIFNFPDMGLTFPRGGFAIVWEGLEVGSDRVVAMKQIQSKNSHGTHKREMRIGKKWFGKNGQIYQEIEKFPGVWNIAALIDSYHTRNDQWLIFE